VMVENEDGTQARMTVRQLFDAIEREADEAEALNLCIAGGQRRTGGSAAGQGGAGIIDAAANLAKRLMPGL
jgi:hypothetical protein